MRRLLTVQVVGSVRRQLVAVISSLLMGMGSTLHWLTPLANAGDTITPDTVSQTPDTMTQSETNGSTKPTLKDEPPRVSRPGGRRSLPSSTTSWTWWIMAIVARLGRRHLLLGSRQAGLHQFQ